MPQIRGPNVRDVTRLFARAKTANFDEEKRTREGIGLHNESLREAPKYFMNEHQVTQQ